MPRPKNPDVDERAFFAKIYQGDDIARLVMADWLDERGKPGDRRRAEWARLIVALHSVHDELRWLDRGRSYGEVGIYPLSHRYFELDREMARIKSAISTIARRTSQLYPLTEDRRQPIKLSGFECPYPVWEASEIAPHFCGQIRLLSLPLVPDVKRYLTARWPLVTRWGHHPRELTLEEKSVWAEHLPIELHQVEQRKAEGTR